MRELEARVLELVELTTARSLTTGTPAWLNQPGRRECGLAWKTITTIYARLTDGMVLPDEMPFRERRPVDGVLGGEIQQTIEVDESQPFNTFRTLTLDSYHKGTSLGFPKGTWADAGRHRVATAGGGSARPKPPLFPMPGGRHRQRAFRDALADLLPSLHGFGPTIWIADFEVLPWM